ncbi:hypothetical protein BO86DRAFT_405362 [Aspergillus japonicus CBS 114.51]|uniref:Zn(2)-C6 fungal-type domain-containing protein n=1 Tax=Aspergillus japonicus CBS 114.51 TaxID=1448312 RepID=A0A8T8XII6_ASPJA|nr:hypothetical protein BO86DRAFT_405362 [Aspergillus japonicus CBS 114.51]RAH87292.1 hypothetical protein BO86DRAFT_405362 [Aspergillus japonicus CBS 114.51]
MSLRNAEQSRVYKKCQKACVRCRSMKVKCSGSNPCGRCARSKKPCHYAVEEARVSVPESYLRDLERRHSAAATVRYADVRTSTEDGDSFVFSQPSVLEHQDEYSGFQSHVEANPPSEHDSQPERDGLRSKFSRNPLVEYSFAQSPDGRFWYMGPTSSWSFCRRVLALLGKHVPDANCPPDPWNVDASAFALKWRPLPMDEVPEVCHLPPIDYGLYLFHTVKYYLGTLFYIIDSASFLRHLHEFYTDPATKVVSMRLWYAQYLLVLAFGKAFLAQNHPPNAPPSGYQYAARAMSLMPDLSGMYPDPLQCIRTLTLAALYFQSIDMRVAAFQHIGFALRFCIIEGIHRHVPEELNGAEFSHQCRTIFWIVYMLDREFAALIGAPSSIRDEDITVRLFSDGAVDEKTITFHVRLARLNARILTTVYGVGPDSTGTLIKDTQAILRNLAELSQDLTGFLNAEFPAALSRASRTATRLVLGYHHSIVLTTRPLVMCALHTHIERASSRVAIGLSATVASLLQCCVESALTVLQTLRTLADEDLIESFLPFQIEDAFASAFILHVIQAIAPALIPDQNRWAEHIDCVLEKIVSKGNLAAPMRRAELENLRVMMGPITPVAGGSAGSPGEVERQQGQQLQEPSHAVAEAMRGGSGLDVTVAPHDPSTDWEWEYLAIHSTIGLGMEPRELMDLANRLEGEIGGRV